MSLSNNDLRKKAKILNEFSTLASHDSIPDLSDTRKIVKNLVKERNDPGKKMMKVGAALILMPEPVTSVAGVPLLLAGRAIASNQSANIKSIYTELQRTLKDLSNL